MAKKGQADKAIQKADKALHDECRRQVMHVYSAAAIALHRRWKYGQSRIVGIFDLTDDVWHEVGNDDNTSMFEILERETGIEMRLTDSSVSWHDINFMNSSLPKFSRMTKAQYIFMRQKQKAWMGAMVQACLYVALARKFDWGTTKLRTLMDSIVDIRNEFGDKEKALLDACKAETGINIVEIFCKQLTHA